MACPTGDMNLCLFLFVVSSSEQNCSISCRTFITMKATLISSYLASSKNMGCE